MGSKVNFFRRVNKAKGRRGLGCIEKFVVCGFVVRPKVRTECEGYGTIGLAVLSEGGVDSFMAGVGHHSRKTMQLFIGRLCLRMFVMTKNYSLMRTCGDKPLGGHS